MPLAALVRYGDVAQIAEHDAAVSIADPAKLRKLDTPVRSN